MDRLVAFHEGGHSVIAYLLDQFPEEVVIGAQTVPWGGTSTGHTRHLRVQSEAIARAAVYGNRDIDRELVENCLVSTAAGPVAEALHMGAPGVRSRPFDWSLFGGDRDRQAVESIRRTAGRLLHMRSLDDAVDSATDLLEQPAVWGSVERVAEWLLRYRQMDYRELQLAVYGS